MPAGGRDRGVGPYEAEVVRRVAERAPLGFAVFLGCLVLNTIFEFLHFPERRVWMEVFAAGFVLLVAVAWPLILRRPAWSVYVMLGFVNVAAVALNAYHLIVGASVTMGLWSLTGLLTASAVILPWGSRSQALACVGALASYPLQLAAGTADPLTWGARSRAPGHHRPGTCAACGRTGRRSTRSSPCADSPGPRVRSTT